MEDDHGLQMGTRCIVFAMVSIGLVVSAIYFIMDERAWLPLTVMGGVTFITGLIAMYRSAYCTCPCPPVDPPRSPAMKYCISIESLPDDCVICYQSLDEDVVVLPCTHAYHKACIAPWFEEKEVCPLCLCPLRGNPQHDQ